MIRITKKADQTLINASVTDFTDSMGYCEFKIPLSISGAKPVPSKSLLQGTRAHRAEEVYEQEHVKLEPVSTKQIMDARENIEFARENIRSTLSIPFTFQSESVMVSLSGRIDKIMREDETLIIQDDKFTGKPASYEGMTQPYPGQLLQVLTYLNSIYSPGNGGAPDDFFEMPHTKKRWMIRICDRETRLPCKVFSEYQDPISLRFLHESLEKFARISLGIAEPIHHNRKSKCDACGLRFVCGDRMVE